MKQQNKETKSRATEVITQWQGYYDQVTNLIQTIETDVKNNRVYGNTDATAIQCVLSELATTRGNIEFIQDIFREWERLEGAIASSILMERR